MPRMLQQQRRHRPPCQGLIHIVPEVERRGCSGHPAHGSSQLKPGFPRALSRWQTHRKSTRDKTGPLVLESQRKASFKYLLLKVKEDSKVASNTEQVFLNHQVTEVRLEPPLPALPPGQSDLQPSLRGTQTSSAQEETALCSPDVVSLVSLSVTTCGPLPSLQSLLLPKLQTRSPSSFSTLGRALCVAGAPS